MPKGIGGSIKQVIYSPGMYQALVLGYIKYAGRYGHTMDELSLLLKPSGIDIEQCVESLLARGLVCVADHSRPNRSGGQACVYISA